MNILIIKQRWTDDQLMHKRSIKNFVQCQDWRWFRLEDIWTGQQLVNGPIKSIDQPSNTIINTAIKSSVVFYQINQINM